MKPYRSHSIGLPFRHQSLRTLIPFSVLVLVLTWLLFPLKPPSGNSSSRRKASSLVQRVQAWKPSSLSGRWASQGKHSGNLGCDARCTRSNQVDAQVPREPPPLEIQNVYDRIVYNRTDSPWPVWDRDVVVQTRGRIDVERKRIVIEMKSITDPRKPEVEGVVRIPRLAGHYVLRYITEDLTEVEYQIDADPGGSLPSWLAELASRDLPYHTIRNCEIESCSPLKTRNMVHKFPSESMNPPRDQATSKPKPTIDIQVFLF